MEDPSVGNDLARLCIQGYLSSIIVPRLNNHCTQTRNSTGTLDRIYLSVLHNPHLSHNVLK